MIVVAHIVRMIEFAADKVAAFPIYDKDISSKMQSYLIVLGYLQQDPWLYPRAGKITFVVLNKANNISTGLRSLQHQYSLFYPGVRPENVLLKVHGEKVVVFHLILYHKTFTIS